VKYLLHLQRNRYANFALNSLLSRYPGSVRRLFRIRKQVNAKAMALFARAYLNLHRETMNENYLRKALDCLDWLIENRSRGFSGYCWGYPFDWQSRIMIPKGTPSVVVTSIAAHAFLDAWEVLERNVYLDIARSCCDFMVNDLNIDQVNGRVCFSYTPLDHFHVHNANSFAASTLLRTYGFLQEEQYRDLGIEAMNFTVCHQNEDGSWYYWAPPDRLLCSIDNYHSGFILECLNVCRRILKADFVVADELRKGLEYYAHNLFLGDGTPKMNHNSIYPIDIHSCAQGLITFCELADFEPKCLNLAGKVAEWTIKNMQNAEGFFHYRIHRGGRVDKTPYIRWGQAWMLRALSYLVQ